MREQDVRRLLGMLGCIRIKPNMKGTVVRSSCPFAAWKHSKGDDRNPSFAITINPVGRSRYRCLACHAYGSLLSLVYRLENKTGRDYSRVGRFIQHHEAVLHVRSLSETFTNGKAASGNGHTRDFNEESWQPDELPERVEPQHTPIPEWHLNPMRILSGEAEGYLARRGISLELAGEWELGWHESSRRIAIPVRTHDGALVGISGRAVDAYNKPKYLHSNGFKSGLVLYGEHKVLPEHRTGVVVEGQFDVLSLAAAGVTGAVAVLGSYISAAQLEQLRKLFDRVVVVPDGDEEGVKMGERMLAHIRTRFSGAKMRVPPDGKDPGDLTVPEVGCLLEVGL